MAAGKKKILSVIKIKIENSSLLIKNVLKIAQAFNLLAGETRRWLEMFPKNFKRISSGLRDISVTANNVKKFLGFKNARRGLKEYNSIASRTVDAFNRMRKASSRVSAAFATASQSLMQMGASIMRFGLRGEKAIANLVKSTIDLGSTFEQSRIIFDQAFGDGEGAKQFNAALAEAEKTSLSTTQILQMLPNFGRQGVDVLKLQNATMKSGNVLRLSGLQMINDLITATGQHSSTVFQNFNKAISGASRNFRALFDGMEKKVSKTTGKTYYDMYLQATTAQERAQAVFTTISETGMAGISKMTENTFKFVLQNLGDIWNNVKGLVGEKVIGKFLNEMLKFRDAMSSLKDSKEVMQVLEDSLDVVAASIKFLLSLANRLIGFFTRLAKSNPKLLAFGLTIAAWVPTIIVLLGALVTLGGVIGTFIAFVLPAMTAAFEPVVAIIFVIGTAMAALVAGIAIVGIALRNHFGPIGKFLLDLTPAFWALIELVSNFKDGVSKMSKQTSDELNATGNIGLIYWTIQLAGFIGSLLQAFKEFAMFIYDNRARIGDALGPALDIFVQIFEIMVGIVAAAARLSNTEVDLDIFNADVTPKIDIMKNLFLGLFDVVKRAMTWISDLIVPIRDFVTSEGPGIASSIARIFDAVVKAVMSVWDSMTPSKSNIKLLKRLFIALGIIVASVFSIIWDVIRNNWAVIRVVISLIVLAFTVAFAGIISAFEYLFGWITFEDIVIAIESIATVFAFVAATFEWVTDLIVKSLGWIEFGIELITVIFEGFRRVVVDLAITLRSLFKELILLIARAGGKLGLMIDKFFRFSAAARSLVKGVSGGFSGGVNEDGSRKDLIPTVDEFKASQGARAGAIGGADTKSAIDKESKALLESIVNNGRDANDNQKEANGYLETLIKERGANNVSNTYGNVQSVNP